MVCGVVLWCYVCVVVCCVGLVWFVVVCGCLCYGMFGLLCIDVVVLWCVWFVLVYGVLLCCEGCL